MPAVRAKGSVLILSLWAVGFFTSVAVAQATRVGLQAKWVGRVQELAQAAELARAGLAYAFWQLDADLARTWDARPEAWAHPEQWAPAFREGEDRWEVVVEDAEGTVNLNEVVDHLPDATVDQLPALAGFTLDQFAQRLRETLTTPAGPKPVAHLEELVTRIGVPREALPALRALVRVWGAKAVNLNAATPTTLAALGISQPLAERICQLRDGDPDTTADDVVFTDTQAIGTALAGRGFSVEEVNQVTAFVQGGWLGVASGAFRVVATGVTGRHGIRRVVTAVVLRQAPGGRPKVVRWEERSRE